jgi:hypothetical protein
LRHLSDDERAPAPRSEPGAGWQQQPGRAGIGLPWPVQRSCLDRWKVWLRYFVKPDCCFVAGKSPAGICHQSNLLLSTWRIGDGVCGLCRYGEFK